MSSERCALFVDTQIHDMTFPLSATHLLLFNDFITEALLFTKHIVILSFCQRQHAHTHVQAQGDL